jgi:GNAT superfamily N-acetyltransferase
MKIIKAELKHLDQLAVLFDRYRIFYKQDSNLNGAIAFLNNRISQNESVIYIAVLNERMVGFTQLYPIFSSVSMEPMYLLNDLFVSNDCRGKGIGHALINASKDLCKQLDFKGLALQTEITNPAQNLYTRLGFIKDPDLHFFWTNSK